MFVRGSILILNLIILSGCINKTQFNYEMGSLGSKEGSLSIVDVIQRTELNQAVDFNVPMNGDSVGMKFSLDSDSHVVSLETADGKLVIKNATTGEFSYTPKRGFRGSENFLVYSRDRLGDFISGQVTVVVANPIAELQPAMAIRSPACVSCHLKTESNFITDFGLNGAGPDRDYTFGGDDWDSGSPYADHGESLNTMKFLNSSAQFILPNARLPAAVQEITGKEKLVDYVKMRLAQVRDGDTEKINDVITPNIQVVEKQKIFIGAPTAAAIKAAFDLPNNSFVYFKDNQTSKALAGLIKKSNAVFTLGEKLVCEGDLAIDGVLYLNEANIETRTGCRIYVTGSVFIYNKIDYLQKTDLSNLQITSSHGIFLGLGNIMANSDDTCEKTSGGWYESTFKNINIPRDDFDKNYSSSFKHRVSTLWTIPTTFLRENLSPKEIGDRFLNEMKEVEKEFGVVKDASCTPSGRDVAFERLLLNAPHVQSRYTGKFKGSIISEYILMSLSRFSFAYDPVFSRTAVFPMLDSNLYLEVK
jgi:hypothetical protein